MRRFVLISVLLCLSKVAFAFETEARHAILMDYDTKTILFEKEAYAKMPPASMSKMMTAYIAFEYLKSGQVKLDDTFISSEKSWKMGGTRTFIPLGTRVSFEDLLKGLIIHSGNDAAVVIAEALMGSEEEFAKVMNETAKSIGMNNSHFVNSTGWPDERAYSCAYDLAVLAYHTIKDFPEYYHYYAQTEFTFNNIKQGNRNGLLYREMGADGLKTGYSDESGYGLAASVKYNNGRLIAVVNGLDSNKMRTNATEALVKYGMMNFTKIKISDSGQIIDTIPVVNGKSRGVDLITSEEVAIIVPKSEVKNIKTEIKYNSPAVAPFRSGDELGRLMVETDSIKDMSYPLVAKEAVEKADFIDRIKNNISSFF